MSDDPQDKKTFDTKGITTVYCNHVAVSLSFNDCRVYISEVSPSEVAINPTGTTYVQPKPNFETKLALVFSPEFTRTVAKSLLQSVEKYESVFGLLRPDPTQEGINKALAQSEAPTKPS